MGAKQRYLIPADKVTDRIIEDEAVILNLDNGQYYTLNYVGTLIWKMLGKQKTLEEISAALKAEYKVDEAHLNKDIASLISNLEHESLIEKA